MIEWLVENKQWVFSGIGVLLLSAGWKGAMYLRRRRTAASAARLRRRHSLVPVVFLKHSPPYNVGECAGFERSHAERFVVTGAARYHRRSDRLYAWWRALIRLGGNP